MPSLMQPSDFLASIERHQQELAAKPDPQEEFAKAQFQRVVDAVMSANKALLSYMKAKQTVSVDNLPAFPSEIKTPDVAEVTQAIKALEKALKPVKQDNSDVVSAIKELARNQVSAADIAKVAKAPVVNVPAPVVNVPKQELDLSPITKAIKENKPQPVDNSAILKALKDVSQQIIKKPTPVANTPTDPLIQYAEADIDDVDASNTLKTIRYYGYTNTSGAWYIRRLDATNIGTTGKAVRIAMGQNSYATNWVNRATLTYNIWGA